MTNKQHDADREARGSAGVGDERNGRKEAVAGALPASEPRLNPTAKRLFDALSRIESCVYAHGKDDHTFAAIATMRAMLPPPYASPPQAAGLRYIATADRCERTEADGTVVHYARSLELRPMKIHASPVSNTPTTDDGAATNGSTPGPQNLASLPRAPK